MSFVEDDQKHIVMNEDQPNNEIGLKINDALTKSGFIALSDFGIPDELLNDVFEASKAFFSLSEGEKKRYEIPHTT